MSALSPRQMFLLDLACKPLSDTFGHNVYLVGTANVRGPHRDVDVRCMLDDKVHDKLRKAVGKDGIALLGLMVGQALASMTDLNIDFQFQRTTEANTLHSGMRNPLGLRGMGRFVGDAQPADVARAQELADAVREENPPEPRATAQIVNALATDADGGGEA